MGSVDSYMNNSPFFIFLNESYIYLEENMNFIQNSHGCIFVFCLGYLNKVIKLTDQKRDQAQC